MKIRIIMKVAKINMFTLLNTCAFSWNTIPPHKNAHPSTSNMFDKIEPSRESLTTWVIPLFSAYIEMINSVAFPNVAFKRPPTARCNRIKWETNHTKHMTRNNNEPLRYCMLIESIYFLQHGINILKWNMLERFLLVLSYQDI